MKFSTLSILCAISILCGPNLIAEDKPAVLPTWTSLFNGKDLTGWTDVNTTPTTRAGFAASRSKTAASPVESGITTTWCASTAW